MCKRTDIVLDAGFKDFYRYCKDHDIHVVIISRCVFPLRTIICRALTST